MAAEFTALDSDLRPIKCWHEDRFEDNDDYWAPNHYRCFIHVGGTIVEQVLENIIQYREFDTYNDSMNAWVFLRGLLLMRERVQGLEFLALRASYINGYITWSI